MTLTDSGPLAAMLNRNDQHHLKCAAAALSIAGPMVTTLACLTEAMHFLHRDMGWIAQSRLWQLVLDGRLEVHTFTQNDLSRMHELMETYRDTPMDLADASLVVLSENINLSVVFTIDSHFRAYRRRGNVAFHVTPSL